VPVAVDRHYRLRQMVVLAMLAQAGTARGSGRAASRAFDRLARDADRMQVGTKEQAPCLGV